MLTFYHSPGAFSLVSHIALEEAGADYDGVLLDFAKAEQHGLSAGPAGSADQAGVALCAGPAGAAAA